MPIVSSPATLVLSDVDPGICSEVREVLSSYARVRFTERRTWFGFGPTVFTITGDAEAVQRSAAEVNRIVDDWWQRAQI
jgi:hypothetical protein